MKALNIKTSRDMEFVNITGQVQRIIDENKVEDGVCYLYVPHTTAAITINEGADPAVVEDIIEQLNKNIPKYGKYHHLEGNAHAHIKASILGSSQMVLIENKKLKLGTWQSIFFCEFDGPRNRRVYAQILK
jgi:secondary thiamine-phosphate synthase enzyme